MGRAARPLHDAGNHHSIARGSDLQAACRGSLRHRLNPPESAKSTPLLHHCAGHDHREFVKGPWSDRRASFRDTPELRPRVGPKPMNTGSITVFIGLCSWIPGSRAAPTSGMTSAWHLFTNSEGRLGA